jgi:SAM-dependent methyltransferase
LGAGTIAGYARPGDAFRFYEINPLVRDVAAKTFHYLGCTQDVSIAIGDARLSLEREAPQAFDVLAVDAFTSDAIPVHLLTKEAFAQYWRHLKPDGVLAVHVTNRYIDLEPIVALAAEEAAKTARMVYLPIDEANAVNNSFWILITGNPSFFTPPIRNVSTPAMTRPGVRAWTDDYSNLWQLLR